MQRVVRSSLVGLLSLAALAACGDSGDTTPVGPSGQTTDVVHSVTVSPSSLSLSVGGTSTLAASVDADGSLARTVTWTSSNTAVATVDATGKVTGVAAGTTTVIAASTVTPAVTGAASVTVSANGSGAVPTVTISSINQTVNGVSSPVNIGNVAGQIDVILNVDTNGGVLKSVTATLKCGTDSIINSQTVSNLAPAAAEAAASPVTLSFNTAQFSSAGVAALHNGTCSISAQATTATGTQSATNSTQLTLNNADVIVGSVTYGATKTDANGLAWSGKTVTVAATPVFYTPGRTAATTTITLNTPASATTTHVQTLTDTGSNKGTQTVTYTDGNDGKNNSTAIDGITDPNASVTVSTIDSNGQPFNNAGNVLVLASSNPLAPTVVPSFRLDTQKPLPGTFVIANNAGQGTSAGGYVNGAFRFSADSASGYCGPNSTGYTPGNVVGGVSNGTPACTGKNTANLDNNGVDNVTVTFNTRLASAKTTAGVASTTASSPALAESQTAATYALDMITMDALGNADTTTVGTFGVDLTAPSSFASTQTQGAPNQAIYLATGTNAGGPDVAGQQYVTGPISDNLSGPGPLLVAQVRNSLNTGTLKASTYEGKTYTNTGAAGTVSVGQAVTDKSPCVVGRFNAAQSAAGANALTVYTTAGAVFGYCTPVMFAGLTVDPDAAGTSGGATTGYVTTEIITADQAGNRSTPFIASIVADATNPVVTGVDLPGSITAGSAVALSATATDSVDLIGSYATVQYGSGINLRYANTPVAGAAAFDNVLTTSATINPAISTFIRELSAAGNPSSTVTANANNVQVGAVDEANRLGTLTASLTPVALGTETKTTWDATNFTGTLTVAADSTTISNCPAPTAGQTTGCGGQGKTTPVHTTSAKLTASASGTTGTFANPFATVTFWYQAANGDYVQIGSTSTASVTDSGVGATGRVWSYSLAWDPPSVGAFGDALAPTAAAGTMNIQIIAVGMNASGDAVASSPMTLTVVNP